MKLIEYREDGFLLQSWIKDRMKDSQAPQGIPHNPPDVRQLDCEAIKNELNELLISRGLFTLKDLNEKPGQLQNVIASIMQKKIIELYKEYPTGLDKPVERKEKITLQKEKVNV